MFALTLFLLAAAPTEPVRLASPGWTYVGLDEKKGEFFADYLAQQVSLRGGVRVTTRSEISALIGFERQKQLLGCSGESTSCLAELAGALGVDGLIVGTLAKIGDALVLNLKVVKSNDGRELALYSERLKDESALLDRLQELAGDLSQKVKLGLGREAGPVAQGKPPPKQAVPKLTEPSKPLDLRGIAWAPAAGAGVLLAAGLTSFAIARGHEQAILNAQSYADITTHRQAAGPWILAEQIALPAAAVSAGVAVWMFFGTGGPAKVALVPSPNGVAVAGVLP